MSSDYHDVPHSVRVALSHLQSSPAPSHFSMISDNPSPQQEDHFWVYAGVPLCRETTKFAGHPSGVGRCCNSTVCICHFVGIAFAIAVACV